MAKRSRGASRPGQQRPTRRPQRGPSRPASAATAADASRPASSLTAAEEARAAELEAEILARERGAGADARARRDPGRTEAAAPRTRVGAQPSGLLAARAAQEYGYVVRDVRRIAVVAGGLMVVLLLLFVLIEVANVIPI